MAAKKTATAKKKEAVLKKIMDKMVTVPMDSLVPYPKNPRSGDVAAIAESLVENGQFHPIVVQKSTNQVLDGNHTYKAAASLDWETIDVVYVDVDDEAAKKIVLAANRTNDLATYDTDMLAELLKSMPDPVGTGYDNDAVSQILASIEDQDADLLEKAMRPAVKVEFSGEDEEYDLDGKIDELKSKYVSDDDPVLKLDDSEEMRVAQAVAEFQMKLELMEDSFFSGDNYYGIPDLRRDMLVDSIPDKLDTWGGVEATPDDGETTWIWNFGVAASKGLPWDRAILSFFTYDVKFWQWVEQPAYQTARVLNNGIRQAIVPDFSYWTDEPRFNHLQAQYRAQWLGRFFQEAGMKVIPRLMWCDLESIKTGILGVPKKAPVVAVCIQAIDKDEIKKQGSAEGLRAMVKELQPESLIVYSGNPGKQVVEDANLPRSLHVRFVDNYAAKRRGVVYDVAQGKEKITKEVNKLKRAKKKAEAESGESPDKGHGIK